MFKKSGSLASKSQLSAWAFGENVVTSSLNFGLTVVVDNGRNFDSLVHFEGSAVTEEDLKGDSEKGLVGS